jgi:uncharacterized membrane protein HdeD (DUF308 family)
MSHAGKSIFVFGLYIIVGGIILLVIPGYFLLFLHIDGSSDFIPRVMGVLLICYGYFYTRAGFIPGKMKEFYTWTIHTRSLSIFILGFFVIFRGVHPTVLFCGLADLAGAVWTYVALRGEKKAD